MKNQKIIIFISVVVSLFLLCYSNSYPKAVRENLVKAKGNKSELLNAIHHFKTKGDSLQLDALYYLIGNMEDHLYSEVGFFDSTETEIEFNVLDYDNYDSIIVKLNQIEDEFGELHYGRLKLDLDLETITSELLIENIEFAFKSWEESTWSKNITYNDFKENILPYRGSNEPIEHWRKELQTKYTGISSELKDSNDLIEVAKFINQDIKSWFKFDPRFYLHPTDQGYSEMCKTGLGRCEDMTNLAIYAMRANGIPVTSDYTPHWADTGNNHAWNAILTPDGEAIPFMGCESDPTTYKLRTKMAKAYRKTYSKQYDNLAFKLKEWEKAPGWLSGKYYTDVTKQYTSVSDVRLEFSEIPDSVRFAYLCVFNSGDWKAIHWSEIVDNSVLFSDMGVDIAYLPMFYIDEELIQADNPFILQNNGALTELTLDKNSIHDISLVSTTQKTIAQATEGKIITFLKEEKEYEFFYWNDEWISLGSKIASKQPMLFENVPIGCLYWLVEKDSRKEERIFTIENGKQIWW
ncbi:MAG: transglutaminase domain-containing protein [Candidatus Marinimicrobia bacterium]|nr:transglutaminase domain-containing protein [Candidatus Neomarinimicrobiota bacterium]MBL7023097.1 transglutaminase domain-containing protein [Candidatus Neomarinimicrobiota bacterium]MBL7109117.1 transglutaminase domain-containing protein [Candidatus Neomarinimicrobiota bacterium]